MINKLLILCFGLSFLTLAHGQDVTISETDLQRAEANYLGYQQNEAAFTEWLAGKSCISNASCSSIEHCVSHKGVPKNATHHCNAVHTCGLGNKCISGICKKPTLTE